MSTEESQDSRGRLYSRTRVLTWSLSITFSSTVLSSLMEEGDFFCFCFLSDLQLNFVSENHSMDLVVPLVIDCNEGSAN